MRLYPQLDFLDNNPLSQVPFPFSAPVYIRDFNLSRIVFGIPIDFRISRQICIAFKLEQAPGIYHGVQCRRELEWQARPHDDGDKSYRC